MLCQSCKVEIPPAWVRAIQRNECPACGEVIMNEESLVLLTELRDAMTQMPNDPEGLAGWLLSNYSLSKIGTAEPTSFHRKPAQQTKQSKNSGLKVNTQNPVEKFLKRAGISKNLEDRKDPREIVELINNGQIDQELYGDNSLDVDEDDIIDGEIYDEQSASIAKQAFNNQLTVPQAGKRPISVEDAAAIMEAVSTAGPQQGGGDGQRALQEARMDRLRKQREVASGTGGGVFRRGS